MKKVLPKIPAERQLFDNRALFMLIGPLIVEQFLAVVVGMADSIMVASVGEAAVSGVSLVDGVNVLLVNIFSALATGGAVAAGQLLGEKNEKRAYFAAGQLFLLSILISVAITVLILAGQRFILTRVFGSLEADVYAAARSYLFILAFAIPFIAVYNAGAALFRVMGNSRVSMYVSFAMNLLNIAGNALLIFVFRMGVAGAALSTLFSRVVAAVFITAMLLKPELPVHLKRSLSLRPDGPMIRRILQVGVPSGLENSMFQLGKILVLSLVASFGTSAIAANAVSNTVSSFQVLAAGAVNLGLIPVVSRCVGAHDFGQARFYTRKLLALAYAATLATNLIVFLILPFILQAYRLSPETAELSRRITLWYGFAAVLTWPMSFTLPNTLRAAGDAVYTMSVSVISMWLCRILLSYVLGRRLGMGVFGTWVAMTIDWQVRIVFFLLRYRGRRWERRHKPASAR